MAIVGLLGPARSVELTFALQRWWAAWNFSALRFFFSLRFEVAGSDAILPGPFLLLSRHASIIDTLLPAIYVVRPFGIKLRYVLKKELLLDPAIDIGGNRLPNHFVDRGSTDSEAERMAITTLAERLNADDAVLIFPEGTRFTEEKRIRYTEKLKDQPGHVGRIAGGLRQVLPPKPGGTLALLEASDADVVVLMHRGLEGFARIKDIWAGDLVDSTIFIQFRRVARTEIPDEAPQRVDWLFDQWASVDDWVVGEESLKGPL
jgi:1-acyl-sn-glycerol-3-phosphate acyltransferase